MYAFSFQAPFFYIVGKFQPLLERRMFDLGDRFYVKLLNFTVLLNF